MPRASKAGSRAVAPTDKLFRRERQVMAYASALASELSAFRRVSISFVAKKSSIKSLLYIAPLKEEEHTIEDDGDVEDDDMGEPAPTPAPASYAQATASPARVAKPTSSKQPSGTSTSSKRTLSGAPSGGKKVVDKNALSARGSPKGERCEQQPHVPPSGGARDDDSSIPRKAKTPRREPCYPAWRSDMLKASRGPPPPDPHRHGTYKSAKDAGIEYGNPLRMVWVRKADHRVWETDTHDGDHLAGFHVDRGDNG